MISVMRSPRELIFGQGVIDSAPALIMKHGSKALVCTDKFLAGTQAFHQLLAGLDAVGVEVTLFDSVEAELPVESVESAARLGTGSLVDVVVGYGGGSSIDLAKATAVAIRYPGDLSRFYGENAVPQGVLPVVAIPTTAGTGSEVTPVAVLSDSDRELKVGISSERIVPIAAIVDPQLTIGCPASVTAFAGVDALCHAVESYTARSNRVSGDDANSSVFIGKNPISDVLALEAIKLISGSLIDAVRAPYDLVARSSMSLGSLLAGMAFGSAGTTAAHALQYPLGAHTKTPHGMGVGLLLPYTLVSVLEEREVELARVAVALGASIEGETQSANASAALASLQSLIRESGVPVSLQELGADADDLPRYAEQAMSVSRLLGNHAVDLSQEDVLDIYSAAHVGSPILSISKG